MDHNLEERQGSFRGGAAAPDGAVGDTYLRETLLLLWRRRLLILATIFTLTAVAGIYAFLAVPLYTTNLQILFESKAGPVFDFKAASMGVPQDEASIISETGVLKSRSVAGRVIRKLNLERDPEFNPELRPKSWVEVFAEKHAPDGWLVDRDEKSPDGSDGNGEKPNRQFAPPPPPAGAGSNENGGGASRGDGERADAQALEPHEWEKVVDTFLEKVDVRQIPRSRSVDVAFTSHEPQVAAGALNMLAEMYLLSRLEDRFENAKRASGWLAERTEALKLRVEQSAKAVEDYRARHNLLQGFRETLISQRISELNGKLTDASIERRNAEANLTSVRRLLRSKDDIESAPQVLRV